MISKITEKIKNEKVFIIAMLLAICSSIIVKPKASYINFKVLVLLFNLMIIIEAFKNLKVMDLIALEILSKCRNTRMVSMVFIILTFFSAMLVTNDVALLTFVPLAIYTYKITKIDPMRTVILQTLAANIGSSLTPMGNPQNLFLFTHYNINSVQFFSATIPFVALGLVWILILNRKVHKKSIKIKLREVKVEDKKRILVYSILFVLVVASVFGLVSYRYTFVAVVFSIIFCDRHLLKEIDYFLLATFICFFIFIGNISNIEIIGNYLRKFLAMQHMPYFSSIILSQVVSNVPCAILVAGFTNNWREVLLGVNIGGMGTLIASLASLISYKIYVSENKGKNREYLKEFNIYNFFSLIILGTITYIIYIYS